MITEKKIFRISIIAALVGLCFLFFYAEELDLKSVERIDSELPEEEVKISGRIVRLSDHEKVSFIELIGERVETVDVILFKDEDIFLHEGDYVEITGTIEEYEGKKEVIANKIVIK